MISGLYRCGLTQEERNTGRSVRDQASIDDMKLFNASEYLSLLQEIAYPRARRNTP